MNQPLPSPETLAAAYAAAWNGAPRLPAAQVPVLDDAHAYAVQDALIERIGPAGGWKVGARDNQAEPNCAPLPQSALAASGATLARPDRCMRGIELEVAVRLRTDLVPGDRLPTREELADAIDAVLPAIEVVDTRLEEGRAAPAPARLADLQSHGALVLGAPSALPARALDEAFMGALRTQLWFDGQPAADTTGGHTAHDLWRLLAWLARHAQACGKPLRAGQVVTTGSCTGLIVAPAGARVVGEVAGIGRVELVL